MHDWLGIKACNYLKSPFSYFAVQGEPLSLRPHAKCKLVARLGAGKEFRLVQNRYGSDSSPDTGSCHQWVMAAPKLTWCENQSHHWPFSFKWWWWWSARLERCPRLHVSGGLASPSGWFKRTKRKLSQGYGEVEVISRARGGRENLFTWGPKPENNIYSWNQ